MLRTRKRTNPLFRPDVFRLAAGDERAERALEDPDSVDLLVWNFFSTLETHRDRDWLATVLEPFGGAGVTPPVRISLWTGARREPLLRPSPGYAAHVAERARSAGGTDADVASFLESVEVPVRIEAPRVLGLVDAVLDHEPQGRGGRDRVVELVDVGLEHARRLDKTLAVSFLYRSGGPVAAGLSRRLNDLRNPKTLAAALPHRSSVPGVLMREVSWQQLLRTWQAERDYLDLGGLPVKAFLDHCRSRGLR